MNEIKLMIIDYYWNEWEWKDINNNRIIIEMKVIFEVLSLWIVGEPMWIVKAIELH